MPVREAAKAWHIPRTTLRDRLKGTKSHQVAADPQMPSEVQEDQLAMSFNRSEFRRLLVHYIVSGNKPFTEAENPMLRQIFEYLNPAVAIHNAHLSGDAIRSKIISEFEKHSATIATYLESRQGLVHISFDGWTARNQLPLYGIACFCRDDEGKPVKLILGVPEISQRHCAPM
jgi:hypothetical protein